MGVPEDELHRLRDLIAVEHEHSNVSGETRRAIAEISDVWLDDNADLDELAQRIVQRLTREQLAEIVTDWIAAQRII